MDQNQTEDRTRVRIIVRGLVQGVFFRAYARDQARQLRLTGWVKNRSDGAVEVIAEGREENLKQLVAWCHEGPSSARVEHVEAEWDKSRGEFQAFEARW